VIALVLAVLLGAPASEAMTATLVQGKVTVAGAPLRTGAVLHAGETIETQSGGRVEIAVSGGALIRLGESSRLTLSAAVPRRAFSARLLLGNLWTRVHKLLAGESFAVETGNGVAGVQGTEFRIEVAPDQPDLVRVYEGAVTVEGREGGWSYRIEPGNELRFRRIAEPPRAFDPDTEKAHRFMEWVRSRPGKDGEKPGQVRRFDPRNPEQEHRVRERIRERRREP
jgi:ferric-dicitrate binding protein FerR (iron transport regulator)